MAQSDAFRCDVQKSQKKDSQGNQVTTVKCHGRLVGDTAHTAKDTVRPLLDAGGKIVVDLGDVTHLDSSGLGTLVGLKVSAINQGLCILEFQNMTPRILELLRITNLKQLFS
jgi:anti-anti-sigma factor